MVYYCCVLVVQTWHSWVFCSGSYKATIEVSIRMNSILEPGTVFQACVIFLLLLYDYGPTFLAGYQLGAALSSERLLMVSGYVALSQAFSQTSDIMTMYFFKTLWLYSPQMWSYIVQHSHRSYYLIIVAISYWQNQVRISTTLKMRGFFKGMIHRGHSTIPYFNISVALLLK